ncbi:MAG TPA: hypothetical protein VGI57_00820 [Usitatibacter sp.]
MAALAGCSRDEGDRIRRDAYTSRADCLADWGDRPEDCTLAADTSQAARGVYWGPYAVHPWYSNFGSSTGAGMSSHAIGSSGSSSSSGSVSRGGFGSTGSAHGSTGS